MNFETPEWQEIEHLVMERIAELDEYNRKPHPPEATASIRGQIAALMWVLEMPARAADLPPPEEILPPQ